MHDQQERRIELIMFENHSSTWSINFEFDYCLQQHAHVSIKDTSSGHINLFLHCPEGFFVGILQLDADGRCCRYILMLVFRGTAPLV